ncbi:helix-turn-helix transcriptional regulator [Olivibacter sp. 47]|uniref:helix-turn-helix domain-containing protein n=1 Tax=Olivibacter sp. 47 TaxID=3056486 RepID=UPI0025A397DC|nr:helix-turn-helix transcriptional regulator [Olivibacter sp. 47]MDM8174753.1 helix-turn-helix transcriptional regulator [Olivibacter sp. 47]
MKEQNDKPYLAIGTRLKEFRIENQVKQTDIQEAIGQAFTHTSRVENGKALPNINYLLYLNEKYDLNINWALTGAGDRKVHPKAGKSADVSTLLARIALTEARIDRMEKSIKAVLSQE